MHPTGVGTKGYTGDVRIAAREQKRLQTQIFYLIGKLSGHSSFFVQNKLNKKSEV